jgi:flagellar hook-associated protein FlgK
MSNIAGTDHQILIEADYIANASENGYSRQNIENFMQNIMHTESGRRILKAVFNL